MKASILTFGCQMNEHDSQRMGSLLEGMGYKVVPYSTEADVVVINTCSVREKPQERLTHVLNGLKKAKRTNPKMSIVVTGCVAQQKGRDIIDEFPIVDAVMGPDAEERLVEYLLETRQAGPMVDISQKDMFSYKDTLVLKDSVSTSHAYITVVKGCDSFCSYCIVPYVRGKERSRRIEEVVLDAEKLVSSGFTSITLLGQNIARFGKENQEDLPSLLRSVSKVRGLKRLSFLTSHPKDFTTQMVRCFEELDNLCPLLHLPAQHGSNRILKAMNRGYTREDYLNIIDELKTSSVWDRLSLTTDVIIGFPKESEEDFKDLMDLLVRAEFDNSYSFIYSARPGTLAYKEYGELCNDEDREVFVARLAIYQEKQKEIAFIKNKKLEGLNLEVLVEGKSQKDPNKFSGRTSAGKVVNFVSKENVFTGSYVMVKIVKAHPTHLSGEG